MALTFRDALSALRSARLPVNLIGYPINYVNRLIGSPITSQSTGRTVPLCSFLEYTCIRTHGVASAAKGVDLASLSRATAALAGRLCEVQNPVDPGCCEGSSSARRVFRGEGIGARAKINYCWPPCQHTWH